MKRVAVIVIAVLGASFAGSPVRAESRFDTSEIVSEGTGSNGDGVLAPGESGTLTIRLVNRGASEATGVVATLNPQITGVEITDDASRDLGDIQPGNAANAGPFSISISEDFDCPQPVAFTLQVETDQGAESIWMTPRAMGCRKPNVSSRLSYTDAETGEPVDGLVIGREVSLAVFLRNDGSGTIRELNGIDLSTDALMATVGSSSASFGDMPEGEERKAAFSVTLRECASPLAFVLTLDGIGVWGSVDLEAATTCNALHLDPTEVLFEDGNGSGFPDPGETVKMFVELSNSGETVTSFAGRLSTTQQHVSVTVAEASFPDAGAGGQVRNTDAFEIALDRNASVNACGPSWLNARSMNAGSPEIKVPLTSPAAFFNMTLKLAGEQGTEIVRIYTTAVCGATTISPGPKPAPKPRSGVARGDSIPATGVPFVPLAASGIAAVLSGLVARRRLG